MLRYNCSSLSFLIKSNSLSEKRLLSQAVNKFHNKTYNSTENVKEISSNTIISNTQTIDLEFNYLGIDENEDINSIHGEYQYDPNEKKKVRELVKDKFDLLTKSSNKNQIRPARTWFGMVRLDSDYVPKFHGQFENDNDNNNELPQTNLEEICTKIDQTKINIAKYTNDYLKEERKINFSIDEEIDSNQSNPVQLSLINNKINFRYSSEFQDNVKKERMLQNVEYNDRFKRIKPNKEFVKPLTSIEEQEQSISDKMANIKLEHFERIEKIPKPIVLSGEDYLKQIRKGKLEPLHRDEYNELDKLKKEIKLDTKGYRILTNQVINFNLLSNRQIIELLEKNILFNDCDIVALNKPYGLSLYGNGKSSTNPLHSLNDTINIDMNDKSNDQNKSSLSTSLVKSDKNISLNSFLPELAKRVNCNKLYTVHRLDRDTTGVLLLAKTQEKASQLSQLFNKQEIRKRYLCITRGVPDNEQGLIDIPIELIKINNNGDKRERMTLCPEPMEEIRSKRRPSREAKKALTKYRIISNNVNAALIEVFPLTGIRHQIRVHLGFGLRCPILGDHKYSHLDKFSPQRLPSDMLMALKVRQSKVRYIPMHLHAYVLVIPKAGKNGKDIFVRAPLPEHFRQNLHHLKLKMS